MTDPTIPSQPTPEQCSANATVDGGAGRPGTAAWYPSMGGYVGRAVIVVVDGDCTDVYVWHDGDFPFDGDDPYRETHNPRLLHHCNGQQFIGFGTLLEQIQGEAYRQSQQAGGA